jgi:hypothetical protein
MLAFVTSAAIFGLAALAQDSQPKVEIDWNKTVIV